ncbi:unnamed protein product [Calypogeia fissa]
MAVHRSATSLLLFAFATLCAVGYFSHISALAAETSRGFNGRRVLYQSAGAREPKPTHTLFSKVKAHRASTVSVSGNKNFENSIHGSFASRVAASQVRTNSADYVPPHPDPPIHTDPPASGATYEEFATDSDADIHTDYAPARSNPPDDSHDYPPGFIFPPPGELSWSEAGVIHATLPPPTIVDRTDNLSGN